LNIAAAIGQLSDEYSIERLSVLQESRRTLEKLFGSALKKSILPRTETHLASPAPEVLACMDSYWPSLSQLTLSVQADPEAVRLCDSFTVEWPSPLTRVAIKVKLNKNAAGEQVRGALYLEASMLLANRALLLSEEARLTVGPDGGGDAKRAADLLKKAAGVFE